MNVSDLCLRIVPLRDVIVHEYLDPRHVERLVERLKADWLLKNPPVTVEVERRYIVLDGATRVSAMKSLGLRDILVQVVDYTAPHVTVDAWRHAVVGLPLESFIAELVRATARGAPTRATARGAPTIEDVSLEAMHPHDAEKALALRKVLCFLTFRDGQTFGLKGQGELEAQVDLLNRLVGIYRGRAEVYRVVSNNLEEVLHEHPDLTALVAFPTFSPAEIVRLAVNDVKLPMGVSRHMISGRALRLNVSFDLLEADWPLEEKNAWLQDMLQERIRSRQVRYYQEPVFIFDE